MAVALLVAGLSLAGCSQYNLLSARKAFKEANVLYQQQDYRRAAEKYEEVVKYADLAKANPSLSPAFFFLGNSYDNLFKPSRKGEPENDRYLEKAIENYRVSSQVETDKTIKTRSLQYLVAAYGPDKVNDPAQAEPLLQEMIRLDPADTSNYVMLSKMYEDAGEYELAEKVLVDGQDRAPERLERLHAAGGLLQPAGRVREDDGRPERAGRRTSRPTPRRSTPSRCTTGRRPIATSG